VQGPLEEQHEWVVSLFELPQSPAASIAQCCVAVSHTANNINTDIRRRILTTIDEIRSQLLSISQPGPGKRLSPRQSLRLSLPILAGTPRNAPQPADAGIDLARAGGFAAPALPLRFRLRSFTAVGDALVPALTGASGDSSSEHDHSPGSLSFAGFGRDTGGLAALPPAPTPPSAHGLSPALRSRACAANPPARNDGSWLLRLRHPRDGYAQDGF
jgi:hypothetical protein